MINIINKTNKTNKEYKEFKEFQAHLKWIQSQISYSYINKNYLKTAQKIIKDSKQYDKEIFFEELNDLIWMLDTAETETQAQLFLYWLNNSIEEKREYLT